MRRNPGLEGYLNEGGDIASANIPAYERDIFIDNTERIATSTEAIRVAKVLKFLSPIGLVLSIITMVLSIAGDIVAAEAIK
jgi:hypothetical protein